jgi:ferritin-like metal-binding protein YciE
MGTRELLVYRLQELYGFHHDLLPIFDAMHQRALSERLRVMLGRQRDMLRTELDTLEQALNLLGARFSLEHSTVAPAFREAMARFRARTDPPPDILDIATVLDLMKTAHLAIGTYEGSIELARAIGEGDVATLLDELLQHQVADLAALRDFALSLISEISEEEGRQAA